MERKMEHRKITMEVGPILITFSHNFMSVPRFFTELIYTDWATKKNLKINFVDPSQSQFPGHSAVLTKEGCLANTLSAILVGAHSKRPIAKPKSVN